MLLVVPLLVEPLLGLLLSTERLAALNPLARFLPFQTGRGMALPGEALVGSQPEALTRVQAVGVFCTFTAVLVALGWAVFEWRDAAPGPCDHSSRERPPWRARRDRVRMEHPAEGTRGWPRRAAWQH